MILSIEEVRVRQKVPAMEARKSFGELLDRVRLRGEEFELTRNGRPVAVLLPIAKVKRIDEESHAALRRRGKEATRLNADLSEKEIGRIADDAVQRARRTSRKRSERTIRSAAKAAGRGVQSRKSRS